MWELKSVSHIVYLDMERSLMRKPTIFASNTCTPFASKTFDTIFYDPPHQWGKSDNPCPTYPSEIKKYYQKHKPFAFTYYGLDKYKTRESLIAHVWRAQTEFYRILKDDGLLMLKWNECAILMRRIEQAMPLFQTIMRLTIADPSHTYGTATTYWLVMVKQKGEDSQRSLLDTCFCQNGLKPALHASEVKQ